MPVSIQQRRPAALAQAFALIERTRMRGLPMLHPALRVEALGFAPLAGADDGTTLGILITPWFMNLIVLPHDDAPALAPGCVRQRVIGGERLAFIGAHEASFGAYEMCSLFSPMFAFADHAAARATAVEALKVLRAVDTPAQPSRRAFLTGAVRR
jgi:[NiFe] hydrogenase assembly HybE family chaperone